MNNYLLIIIFSILSLSASGQTNDQLARQKYQEAKQAYEKNDYGGTVSLLLKVSDLLGKTNLRIQPLLIKALSQAPAWQYVKEEVDKYLALKPDTTLVEYSEIMAIGRQAEGKVNEENSVYQSIKETPTVAACNRYLTNYPYGKYKKAVKELIKTTEENDFWEKVKSDNYLSGYYDYVDKYPNGQFLASAKRTIAYTDSLWYDKAEKTGTITALQQYLKNNPRGEYRYKANRLIRQKQDQEAYAETLNSKSIENAEKYLKDYPNGQYVVEATINLKMWILQYGDNMFNQKDWESAQNMYKKYRYKFPAGERIDYANKQIIKCDKMIARDIRRAKTRKFFREASPWFYGIGAGVLALALF